MARGDVGFGSSSNKALFQYNPSTAVRYLKRKDATMAALIKRVGPFAMQSRAHMTPFQGLLRAIVYQQLSGHAAGSIDRRFKALFPARRPSAKRLLALDEDSMRDAGLSRSKIASARDLAQKYVAGAIPNRRVLAGMDDEAVIELLISVRGIGRWSAQMLLMFNLGRADVFPVDDLGVRKGYMLHIGNESMPTPKELDGLGEIWRPYRSVASWYLWRACELDWPQAKA